jgi:FKBP-type peptidyl-prolyl cis-trans isomerase FklB|tara:strand:- start:663 stop:1364 length:702 start_codon:yes stop_codon:yes gene_type:complete
MNIINPASQVISIVTATLLSTAAFAQGDISLDSEEDKIAYSIGVNIGQSIAAQGILEGINTETFVSGLLDAVAGDLKMSDEDMFAAIQLFQQQEQAAQQAALTENLDDSAEFLAANASKAGVVALDSGLQYQILESGTAGSASPSTSDSVLAHYHGTLTDGTVFDSSVDRGEPATFGLSQVIAGWTEALQLMTVGDKWRLFIPPGLAYGEASPTPAIPPNSALIFDVELLEIR